ncbi:MAG TPA: amino acid ABC transporter substrate-binding protein [Stellaceae bacterium]|nr:amino acid ABC transporter substrate-binding protein [Stellaceae bacterium]
MRVGDTILGAVATAAMAGFLWHGSAAAAEPVKIGCSMAMTGGVAGIGKQIMISLEIWRDQVNANGGLLGRPVQLDCYDDQSNPANVPGIYTKLIDIDKVDLLIGPYATNMVAAAIPVIMQKDKMTIGLVANAANHVFHYPRYFSMNATGPDPEGSYSTGFFAIAGAQNPRPKTIAMLGADAEYGHNAIDGTRKNAKKLGYDVVYDRYYPPDVTDCTPIMRAVQATHPDIVFVAAYPPDTVCVVRAAAEIGLDTKIFGGALVGLGITSIKLQLGPLMNGMINNTVFAPAKTLMTPEAAELIKLYQARAAKEKGVDPLGYVFPPFGYAAGQVLAAAVTATKSFDADKLAQYLHTHTIQTVLRPIAFNSDGEWTESGRIFTQFRHVVPNDIDQFRTMEHEAIVWPDKYKTGDFIYPYDKAKK